MDANVQLTYILVEFQIKLPPRHRTHRPRKPQCAVNYPEPHKDWQDATDAPRWSFTHRRAWFLRANYHACIRGVYRYTWKPRYCFINYAVEIAGFAEIPVRARVYSNASNLIIIVVCPRSKVSRLHAGGKPFLSGNFPPGLVHGSKGTLACSGVFFFRRSSARPSLMSFEADELLYFL